MTLKAFLSELSKIKGWVLKNNGEIRWNTRRYCYCPITAVAVKKTGKFYGMWNFEAAAEAIGLKDRFAQRIIEAADDPYTPVNRRLRRQLLKATRAKELE